MKCIYISINYLFAFFIIFCGSFSKAISDDNIHLSITEMDLKLLENGDSNYASVVLQKMIRIYKNEGKDPLIPAIPALINRASLDLKMDDMGESEGELFGDIVWALSVTGDKRVESVLIKTMLSPKVYSWDVPKGFLIIGKSTFPQLLNYLYIVNDTTKNVNDGTRCNVVMTLAKMGEFDSTGTYFTENDKKLIKEEMLKLIKDKNEFIRTKAVMALSYFGDKSTIPILNEVKNSDPFLSKKGIYLVRIEAEKAINKIMKK